MLKYKDSSGNLAEETEDDGTHKTIEKVVERATKEKKLRIPRSYTDFMGLWDTL